MLAVCTALAVLGSAPAAASAAGATKTPATPTVPTLVDALAKQLHVTPARVEAAVRAAELARLDAASRLHQGTPEQTQAIRARIQKEPLTLVARFGAHGPGPVLRAAASFIGLAPEALVAELRGGKTLAEVAQQKGKTREGLQQALLQTLREQLQSRPQWATMTPEQRQQTEGQMARHVERLLDRRVGTTPTRALTSP